MLTVGPDLTPHEWGGRACLALVNSVVWRRSDAPIEVLTVEPAQGAVRLVGLKARVK